MGRDVILVPPHVEGLLQEQALNEPGGLKGAAASAGATVSDAYGTAKDKVTETYANIAGAII